MFFFTTYHRCEELELNWAPAEPEPRGLDPPWRWLVSFLQCNCWLSYYLIVCILPGHGIGNSSCPPWEPWKCPLLGSNLTLSSPETEKLNLTSQHFAHLHLIIIIFTPGCMFSNSFAPTCILSYLRTQRLQQSFLLLWAEKWTSPRADPPESSILRPCLICTWDRLKLCSVCNSKVHQVKPLDLEKLKLVICRWSRLIFSSRAITLEARPASSLHCWTRRLPNLTDGVKQFFSHTSHIHIHTNTRQGFCLATRHAQTVQNTNTDTLIFWRGLLPVQGRHHSIHLTQSLVKMAFSFHQLTHFESLMTMSMNMTK